MLQSVVIRGVWVACWAALLVSSACSSSDALFTPAPEGGTSGAAGDGISGAPSSGGGGKAGTAAGGSGAGGSAHAGAGQAGDAGRAGAGQAGGAGGAAGSGQEAGSGGEGDPCAACPSGLCLPDGQCVACLPSSDRCPDGQYCSDANQCVAGCKGAASCASGVCSGSHDCQNCISDLECGAPRVCGAQQCAAACTAQQEGGNAGCGAALTCCSLHCVDVVSDHQHCGACGSPCTSAQFCGRSGCFNTRLSSLCKIAKIVIVLDGQAGDDPVGRALAQALVDRCSPQPLVREVTQTTPDALNPANGRPVAGSDELMVVAGGSVFQHAADYLVTQKVAPVSNAVNGGKYEIRNSSSGAVIASEPVANANTSHDLFAAQFVRDPSSGSLILNAYGFTAGGTAAAAAYFEHVLAPDLANATKVWYVGEWTDQNNDHLPDVAELSLIDSGG